MLAQDFPRWREHFVAAYAAEQVRHGHWSESVSLREADRALSMLLPDGLRSSENFLFTVKADDGADAGALWVRPGERAMGAIWLIYDLVIWPEYRRRGHAARALLMLEMAAQRYGLRGLAVHVSGLNRSAQDLYVKLGYRPIANDMFKPLLHQADIVVTVDPQDGSCSRDGSSACELSAADPD